MNSTIDGLNNEMQRVIDMAGNKNLEIAREEGVWWVTVRGIMYKGETVEGAIKKAENHQRELAQGRTT